jgi:glutamate dehydrogenase/leucine dehydrogenase
VAQYATEKVTDLGGRVVTLSDSNGFIYDPKGVDPMKLQFVMELKNIKRGRIKEYAEKYGVEYFEGKRPWIIKCDIAMPNATQNEIDEDDARILVNNGCICVSEGANMPSTPEAVEVFLHARILYGPGKAANAGGVATSGLEMTQNSMRLPWSREEVDDKLQTIMRNIHKTCVTYGTKDNGFINYVDGANIGGFVKVANAMIAQGIV